MNPDQPTAGGSRLLLRSYVPLLYGPPERALAAGHAELDALAGGSGGYPSGQARDLFWVANREGVQPVFVLDQGYGVAIHLMVWSAHRPEDWFALCLHECRGGFVAALVPNLARSAGRFEERHLEQFGRRPGVAGYDHLFRPVHFACPTRRTFERVRRAVPDQARVGLLDSRKYAPGGPPADAFAHVRPVGPFPVFWDGRAFGYDMRPTLDRLFAAGVGDGAGG